MPDINKASLDKFQIYRQVTASGQIGLDRYIVKAEASLRVTLDNAVGSTVDIYGAIGDGPFDLIGSIAGSSTDVFDISSVDYIYFTCSTFFATFDLFAAGFYTVSPESAIVPAGAATEAKQDAGNTSLTNIDAKVSTAANQTILNTRVGDLTETAPGTDTASSGLNGRLQRIAQRITSLIALLPTSLGQKTSANSFPVVVASDQSPVTISFSATSPTIANVAAATKNTEYSYAFPANTKKFILRARQAADMQFSYTSGQSGTTYFSVPAGGIYEEFDIKLSSTTIYFRFNKDTVTLEVVSWV